MIGSAQWVDARTDLKWVQSVQVLVEKRDWLQLWRFGLKTPPIWTLRILKYLQNENWTPPPEEQLEFFYTLSNFASKCNQYDLPAPTQVTPLSGQIEGKGRLLSARLTADGEFVFALDNKGSFINVCSAFDGSIIEQIRVDIHEGRQHAVLAFAVAEFGARLAVLTYCAANTKTCMHLYHLQDGELKSCYSWNWTDDLIGKQIPRLAMARDGRFLLLLTGSSLRVWKISQSGLELDNNLLNPFAEYLSAIWVSEDVYNHMHYNRGRAPLRVTRDSAISDWKTFGRYCIADPVSRRLEISNDGSVMAASTSEHIVVRVSSPSPPSSMHYPIPCPEVDLQGHYALTPDGRYIVVMKRGIVELITLNFTATDEANSFGRSNIEDVLDAMPGTAALDFARCLDPVAAIAISPQSDIVAIAMSHGGAIRLWHIPDGRALGMVPGLERDVLADFRFTTSGSLLAVTRFGRIQTWESDGNGNVWPWSPPIIQLTHQSVDQSSVRILREAQEMRRRGWLSPQECNLLDLSLALMHNRLSLDVEVDGLYELPGDVFDIEIDDEL